VDGIIPVMERVCLSNCSQAEAAPKLTAIDTFCSGKSADDSRYEKYVPAVAFRTPIDPLYNSPGAKLSRSTMPATSPYVF